MDINYPGSSGIVDQEGVCLMKSGEVVPPDIPIMLSQFQKLNSRQSPVVMSSEEQGVVESPTKYEAPVGSRDISPAADGMAKMYPLLSQVSALSSGQWSPNRVRRISPMIPWMFFRCFKCLRIILDIFPIHHRSRHRSP